MLCEYIRIQCIQYTLLNVMVLVSIAVGRLIFSVALITALIFLTHN